jgi:SAM-dependent methyltransferase
MRRRVGFLRTVAQPGRLLDFGCGDGGFLVAAGRHEWDGVGVEMKPDDARAKGVPVVERIDEITGQFDAITLWHSLEHMSSPRQSLAELLPLLRPGGHVLIAVPNRSSLQAESFGRHWFHLDVPRHLFHFNPTALSRLLALQGFEVVRKWDLEAEIDLFGWVQSALNMALPNPNVLHDVLTHRRRPHRTAEVAASVVLGGFATALFAPATAFAAVVGRGAITIVAARQRS